MTYKKALISVSDKTGLYEFLQPLTDQGMELVSTGGTAEFLKSKGFKVRDVQDLTGFPEALSGRVKTLHPHVYMPLLAREWNEKDQKTLNQYHLQPFDLVIGGLYPFEDKSAGLEDRELVEWIDVGGPGFLRAAAKNYFSVTVVCDPKDYPKVQKGTDLKTRKQLAGKVFERTSLYDSFIAKTLKDSSDAKKTGASDQLAFTGKALKSSLEEKQLVIKGDFFKRLRYGENPHQKSSWYKAPGEEGLHSSETLQGKTLSYNNLLDFWTALSVVREFKEPCAVAVKHNNPCGVATAKGLPLAVERAIKADPLSVFGGLLAFNRPLDRHSAEKLTGIFIEGLIAPDFSPDALDVLKSKKNLRVLRWPDMLSAPLPSRSIHEIMGGFLVQTRDQTASSWSKDWKLIGAEPSEEQKKDLLFAWKICAHLKSNAIAIVRRGQSLGLGMGQVSRVSAVRLALNQVKELHPSQKRDLVLASDAFFPFPDSIELAGQGGVSWIIQPGGSVQDKKVLKKVLELGLNMVLTGQRHFKH